MILRKFNGSTWDEQAVETTDRSIRVSTAKFGSTTEADYMFDTNHKLKPAYLPDVALKGLTLYGTISADTDLQALTSTITTNLGYDNAADAYVGHYWVVTGSNPVTITEIADDEFSTSSFDDGVTVNVAGEVVLEPGDWLIITEENLPGLQYSVINNTYGTASSDQYGVVKIGYSENGKNYPVELDNGEMFVNVPWTDTNTLPGDGDITIASGTGLTGGAIFSVDQDNNETFTISHADTSSISDTSNSGNQVIQNITWDGMGHAQTVTNKTITLAGLGYVAPTIGDGSLTVTAGGGLTGGGLLGTANQTGATSVTINHADTSNVANMDTNGAQVIDTMTFDGYGHTTGFTLRTLALSDLGYTAPDVGDGSLTVNSGTGISGGGQLGTANQSTNTSLTLALDYPVYYAETEAALPTSGVPTNAIGFEY
jgi:hypothetical protein